MRAPQNPNGAGDGFENYHKRVLYRIVAAHDSASSSQIQRLYEALSPLLYRGTTQTPVHPRYCRKLLTELDEEDRIDKRDTPHGMVYIPTELPDDVEQPQTIRQVNDNESEA